AAGRRARRGAVRDADAGLPVGEGDAAGPRPAGDLHRHPDGARPTGDRRGAACPGDVGPGAPHPLRRLLPRRAPPPPAATRRPGLPEMGLPSARAPAIPRHLAAFLKRHPGQGNAPAAPAAILFNGGVFQPAALRDRLVEVMGHWYASPERPWQPLVLTNPSLDLA